MPSYLIFNKSNEITPVIENDQAIMYIDYNNNLILKDSNNLNITIPTSGTTSLSPSVNDFTMYKSYSNWLNGLNSFGPNGNENKFSILSQEYYNNDYLSLEFTFGEGNSKIFKNNISELFLTSQNLNFRDDGYGLYATNYFDYLNNILMINGLYSRFLVFPDDSIGKKYILLNRNYSESFIICVKETGKINNINIGTYYYFINVNVVGINDGLVNDFQPKYSDVVYGDTKWSKL